MAQVGGKGKKKTHETDFFGGLKTEDRGLQVVGQRCCHVSAG